MGVVYEPWQFSCVGNWLFNSYPDQESIRAARDALAGWDPTGGALYYFNYHTVSNSWLVVKTGHWGYRQSLVHLLIRDRNIEALQTKTDM